MYFDPATKAPISLLEFGVHTRSEKLVVCCPEGFWKWGNVQVTCEYYGVEMVPSLDKLAERVRTRVESKGYQASLYQGSVEFMSTREKFSKAVYT
jgi:hypothetical protein